MIPGHHFMNDTLSGIRLDENHVYWRGEVRVPGFSEILRDLNVTQENPFYTDDGKDEGNALHLWLKFLASGNEPEEEPDPRIAGRVEGIRKFLQESDFFYRGAEEPQYHPSLVYATTPDLWGEIGGIRCVVDAKRGTKELWHPLQTAAQKMALTANLIPVVNRYALYLKDGDYRLVAHTDRADEMRWTAIVNAFHAKKFHSKGSAL